MRRVLSITALGLLAVAVFSCARIEKPVRVPVVRNMVTAPRLVRVLLGAATRNQPLELSSDAPVDVWTPDGQSVVTTVNLSKTKVSFRSEGIVLGDAYLKMPAVILTPAQKKQIDVKGIQYPGEVVLVRMGDSVQAINRVAMEQYVAGVVSCEMPAYFERSALEAQAVAARTYVLWQMRNNRLGIYDVKDDVSSQVYRGTTGTNSAGRAAAENTAGVILTWEWKFLPALYHSTCGGHTLSASNMRGAPIIAPLRGVECGYCRASKRYHWPLVIPEERMEEALAKADLLSGRLLDVNVTKTLEGGWVDTVAIKSEGAVKQISGYALRQAIGTSELYSTKFTMRKSGNRYVLEGYGFGHGVGMCQWGANGMALSGCNYAEILRHYYPGAEILKIY